ATPAKSGDAAAATTLADITPRTDLRTHYPFWPAPSGFETVYLEADPPPKVVDWSDNMTHNTNYDTPKYPQPGIVNDRDLSEENHYTYRVSPTEVH
ncbi:MAG: hypothetical protein ACREJ2_05500, partial [Planctomycetota bacterium]